MKYHKQCSELLTCALEANIDRKMPKITMEAECSKKMNQTSKQLRPIVVATPPIVKQTEQIKESCDVKVRNLPSTLPIDIIVSHLFSSTIRPQ